MPTRTNHGQAATANAANNTPAAPAAQNNQSTQNQNQTQNGNAPAPVGQQNQANQAPVSQPVAQSAQVYPYACADMFAGIFSAMASAFAAVGQQSASQQTNSAAAQNGTAQTAPAPAPQQNQGGQNGATQNGNQNGGNGQSNAGQNGGNQNGNGNQGNGGQNGGNQAPQNSAAPQGALDWYPVRMYVYWIPELKMWSAPLCDLFAAKQAGNGIWDVVYCKARRSDGSVFGFMTEAEIDQYLPKYSATYVPPAQQP